MEKSKGSLEKTISNDAAQRLLQKESNDAKDSLWKSFEAEKKRLTEIATLKQIRHEEKITGLKNEIFVLQNKQTSDKNLHDSELDRCLHDHQDATNEAG